MKILITAIVFVCKAALAQDLAAGSFEFIYNISGNRDDQVRSVALGADGSIYVAGLTNSSDFVTTQAAGQVLASPARFQAFVRRLSPDGAKLVYSTLLGPSRLESPLAMGVDAAGNAYVAYYSYPDDTQPVKSLEPAGVLVVVKLGSDGASFLYRVSVLPGAFFDPPVAGFAVDKNGVVYVAAGDYFSFGIRRIDPSGNRIEAQTTVGCGNGDRLRVNALALGPDGSVYVAGFSNCRMFPATPNAYRVSTANPQNGDAFVMRFDPVLTRAIYATLLGGEAADEAFALTVAEDGSATATGITSIRTDLAPMPATPLGFAELKNKGYGFAATLSPDGSSLKGAVLLPSDSLTAVSTDSEGNIYVGGSSFFTAILAKISPNLQTVRYIVEPPARDVRVASIALWKSKLLFGGSAKTIGFPDNDPNIAGTFNGFAGSVRESPVTTNLRLEVQTSLTVPEIYGSYTTCRYVLTNDGASDATNVLLLPNIEGNASFGLWQASPPIFNVPTFSTGSGGAAVRRLGAGESATIEFLSSNDIFPSGVQCSGRLYSAAAEEDFSDNEASMRKAPQWVRVTIGAPGGIQLRRDDWPVLRPAGALIATANSQMRIYFPSPQQDVIGRIVKFDRWSDGSTDNPRTFAVGDQNFSAVAIFSTVPAITPPTVDPDPQPAALAPLVQPGETPLYMQPREIAIGSAKPVIVVNGAGLREGWEALWNGKPRPTEYLNSYQLQMTLQPEDLERPSLSWISVRDPERNVIVRAPQAFWVYLPLPNNDVLYDGTRSRLWVAASGQTGVSQHEIALVNPETGKIEQALTLPAEPQKLALTDGGQYLYIATPGRIYRLNTESLALDREFAIPPTDFGSLPPEANSMLAVPGRPDQVLVSVYAPSVSSGYSGTILFENGLPSTRNLRPPYGPAFLYGWLDQRTVIGGDGRALYYAAVENGIELQRTLEGVPGVSGCVLESRRLYCGSGAVLDAATGSYVRQYPARGAVGVLPLADRVVFFDSTKGFSRLVGPMVVVQQSTSEFLSGTTVPLSGSIPGTLPRWGEDGLIYRPVDLFEPSRRADKLYLFNLQ